MNLKPEQVPDEVVEAAARAVERQDNPHLTDEEFEIWWNHDPLFCERRTTWVGYTDMTRKEVALCQARVCLAAALPVLLGEPAGWKCTARPSSEGTQAIQFTHNPGSADTFACLGWTVTPAYTLPTQDTPNEQV